MDEDRRTRVVHPSSQAWSLDPVENAAVQTLQEVVTAMVATLHAVPGARSVDPAGGFTAGG